MEWKNVVSIFGFVDKYLAKNGSIFLFYDDDFRVLRDIKSYLEDYNFKIHSKFAIVNNLHRTSLEFPSKKVNLFAYSTIDSLEQSYYAYTQEWEFFVLHKSLFWNY